MNFQRSMKWLLIFLLGCSTATAQFSVSENKHYLLKNEQPFFWLGDTAWELFHRLTPAQADSYFKTRSAQGFTVIQAVVLAELDGLREPNAIGQTPLLNNDPLQPNEAYFRTVDQYIDLANSYGLSIALLPTWGDKLFMDKWGKGPEIFTVQNAAQYAGWLAKRYCNRTNIIWILGGDRNPRNELDVAVWNAMGGAIQEVYQQRAVISFHPQPSSKGSLTWFNTANWLSFTMFQTGHCRATDLYSQVAAAYANTPTRPVLDGEPIYEDHPVCFNKADLGLSNAYDVRRSAYLSVFAGAFGHTYGCHDVWQMYAPSREPVNSPNLYWYDALELPGAEQMKHLRRLIEKFPLLNRVPDQSIVAESALSAADRIQATRGDDFALIYTSTGLPFTVYPGKIKGKQLSAYWYDPRNGKEIPATAMRNNAATRFVPPSTGYGKDWVLVLQSGN